VKKKQEFFSFSTNYEIVLVVDVLETKVMGKLGSELE